MSLTRQPSSEDKKLYIIIIIIIIIIIGDEEADRLAAMAVEKLRFTNTFGC